MMDVDALIHVQYVNLSEHGAASEAVGSSEISRPATEFMEEEKASVASRSRRTRSTAPRRPRRKPNKRLITRDIIDLDLYP